MVTASLLLAVIGPTLGSPGRGAVAWAQTASVRPAASVAVDAAKPDAPQPSPEEVAAARNHFESGVDFFERGNYAAARAEFEASYQLTKYPQLLFNLGKTAEKLNQDADAIRYFDSYLAASPNASDAAEVRTKLADLRQRAALANPPPPPPPPPSKVPPIPALALMGAGVGLLIAGIGCGAGALSAQSSLENVNDQPYAGTLADNYSRGRTLNTAAITLDVIGGVALAAGGAWTGYWLYKRHKASQTPAPAVSLIPRVIPMGLGIGIAGRF